MDMETTPRTNTAARESVRLNDRQPLLDECARLETELARLRHACRAQEDEICQLAGKALGYYPWFKDHPEHFPGADESCGVCVGDHVAETIVEELAKAFVKQKEFIGDLVEIEFNDSAQAYWRIESIRIPAGSTLYIGGNKP